MIAFLIGFILGFVIIRCIDFIKNPRIRLWALTTYILGLSILVTLQSLGVFK